MLTAFSLEGIHLGGPWFYPRWVDRDQIHVAVAQERRRVADLIDSLDEAQLATESLCTGWDVKTVAAHLVSPLADGTVKPILLRLCRPRGSLDRVVDERARRRAQMPAAEIAATLRDLADHQYWYPPPQAAAARLAEVLSHSGDIRIPLGLPFEPDPQLTATALDFLTGPVSLGLVPWGRLRGLRLHATDINRGWGKDRKSEGGSGTDDGRGWTHRHVGCARRVWIAPVTAADI